MGSRGEALSQREARLMEEAKKTEVIVAESKFVVSLDNLRQYLGRPKFGKERWYSETPVGVVMGLVTTQAGGQIAYIESRYTAKHGAEPGCNRTLLRLGLCLIFPLRVPST